MASKIIPEKINHSAVWEIYFKEYISCTICFLYKSFYFFLVAPDSLQWRFWELWVLLSPPENWWQQRLRSCCNVTFRSWPRFSFCLEATSKGQRGGRHRTLSNALTLPLGIAFSPSCVRQWQQALRASQNPGLFTEQLLWFVSFYLKGLSLLTSSDT